ncbi:MAG: hypothetical protein ACREBR_05000 [bacterium]
MSNFKIGDTVYTFSENRRVYEKQKPGELYSRGGPIYREHFVKQQIVGETTQSWIVAYEGGSPDSASATKHKKKGDYVNIYTAEQVEEQVYHHDHAYYISELVRKADYTMLRKIAELLNYQGGK